MLSVGSIQDMKQCPYWMPVLQAAALPAMQQWWTPYFPLLSDVSCLKFSLEPTSEHFLFRFYLLIYLYLQGRETHKHRASVGLLTRQMLTIVKARQSQHRSQKRGWVAHRDDSPSSTWAITCCTSAWRIDASRKLVASRAESGAWAHRWGTQASQATS